MKPLNKLKTLARLSPSDRLLLSIALILLMGIRLGLWLLPFQVLLQRLTQLSQQVARLRGQQVSIASIIWTVNTVSRYFIPGSKCLARALTTQILLNWQGYPSDFRIGVAKGEKGQLEAHAWVEVQGQVVMGYLSDLTRYTLLPAHALLPHSANGY
jgi:Transglutaminase-like superfamily